MTIDIDSLQPTIAELERVLDWAYGRYLVVQTGLGNGHRHGVPPITVVVQTRGQKKNQLGAFSKERWSSREGALVHEVTFSAECLNRDIYDIVETACHEVVHLVNCDDGVRDMAKGGRHNKEYAATAELVGLDCQKDGSRGWSKTSLTDKLRHDITVDLKPDVAAFRLFRTVDLPKDTRKSTVAWTCDCTKVRTGTGVQLNAECQECGQVFVRQE